MEEEEIKEESKILKVILFIVGIILIILMISYIFVGYPLGHIIRGQLSSFPLEDNKILVENLEIQFTDKVLEELKSIYFKEEKHEFSVCLLGQIKGEMYLIKDLYQPKTFVQTFNHVTFEPCSQETLIMLHSHPYKSCLASSTDLNTLKRSQQGNPKILMIVMCEPSRFSVYR